MTRLVSLAAGVSPELGPADFVSACAEAGWKACGIWFDAETWTDRVTSDVRDRLRDEGLVPLDMEALFVRPEGDDGDRLIEAASEIGARNVLVVSRGVERERFTERFAELCDLAAPAGIRCAIEFIPFFDIKTVSEAAAVVRDAGRANGAVLADNLHLSRSGGTAADITRLAPSLFPYAQLCDAAEAKPESLYKEAVDGRMMLGEGGLPTVEFVNALPPETPLSLEVRSKHLRETYPDHVERAGVVLRTTEVFLANMSAAPPKKPPKKR